MEAKLNIHFKRQADGSVLATAVMTATGTNKPGFYRVKLAPDVDPYITYNDVAAQAISHIMARRDMAANKKEPANGEAPAGRVIQFRGALPT